MFKLFRSLFFISIIAIETTRATSNKQCIRCNEVCVSMYAYILQCSNNWARCEHQMLDILLSSGHNIKDAKKECYAFFNHMGCKEGTTICDRLLVLMSSHLEGENKLSVKINHQPHVTKKGEEKDMNFVDKLIVWIRIFLTIAILFISQVIVHFILAYYILQVNIIAIIFSQNENNGKPEKFDDLFKENVNVMNRGYGKGGSSRGP